MNIKKLINLPLHGPLVFVSLGFFGNYFYLFDLFSHFYLQLFVVNCIFLIWYIWLKNWFSSIVSLLLGLFLFVQLANADFSGIYSIKNITRNPDIFYMNTEFLNADISKITDYIDKVQPKQIALVELNKELFENIKNDGKFKYSYYFPGLVFSFGFFTNEEVLDQKTYFSWWYPIGYFRTNKYSYYIIHPLPPFNNEQYQLQKNYFNFVSELIKHEKNFVLVGDFNSSNYSQVYKSYFWEYTDNPIYSWWVDTILTIPIDHAISNKPLEVMPGIKLSSDHIPLLIKF